MKFRSFNLITLYYTLGSLILFAGFISNNIYSTWLISILPLSIYLLFNENFNIKSKLEHILLSLFSFLSLIINFINLNISLIPFFLLTNSIYIKHTFNKLDLLYKINRIIAILGANFFFISCLFGGRIFSYSPFLFSKNMIILPFVSFMTLFHINKRGIFDNIIYFFILIVLLLNLSFGNFTLGLIFFICIFLPNKSFSNLVTNNIFKFKISKKSIFKIFLLSTILTVIPIILIPFLNLLNIRADQAELIKLIELLYLFFRDLNLYSFIDLTELIPRFYFAYDYISSLSISSFILGNPNAEFYFGIGDTISNPHNSLIVAHMNMGIIGFFLYLYLFIKTIFVFFKKNIKISILSLGLLIRSMSDSILILTGVGSFLIFVLLFQFSNDQNKTEKLI